jgi:SMI1 / KNR4 family (SUKH-1)
MAVIWQRPLPGRPQASPEAVAVVQRTLGVRFPADYLAIATTMQGASPDPSHIKLSNGVGTGFGSLLHFEEAPPFSNIVARRWPVEDWLPPGVVPFADTSGDLWCFDFRANPDQPSVVYYQHDDPDLDFPVVATSFTDLLEKLS